MKSEITLNNYFIFNSTLGVNEGEEHMKILYYYPNNQDLDFQMKSVGLVEALIQFTNTFKPSSPVNSLHTQKKRQLYFQPEDKFWIVLTLNVPYSDITKDGSTTREYIESEIQDNVYKAILEQSYKMYKLFNSTFQISLEKLDVNGLKSKLQKFYDTYLKTIKLDQCDILNIFNGIHFLPLDTQNFLNVQCFVNEMECEYPIINHTLFMYNEHVIWSGIEPEEMQTLYQYLVNILLPTYTQNELQGGSMPRNPSSPFSPVHYGRFVNVKSTDCVGKLPKIVLTKNNESTYYNMLIYRTLSASICLFIEDGQEVTGQIIKSLEEFMGPKLVGIVSDIAEYYSKQNASSALMANTSFEVSPKYIYFNKMNLAYKSTTHLDKIQTGNLSCPKDCVKIMADICARKSVDDYASETIVKTLNDNWIIGKRSNLREFYVALQQKDANIKDISGEVKKLSENQLKGIFFHN
ncbi:vacuolar fusion protein CCZ1 homolog [Onthophagus taurus]|uniref:vacuolar fusion protein CCZ1 homolog n=1 Tax=Onthophagus taurus TaxID=166361 RepID=UPI000C20716A|nr:vacuolar fusion protein CCZ1 homolog [Onthophagus taurus]